MWLIFLLSPYSYSSSTYERFYDDINYITTKLLLNSVGDSASEASQAVAAAFSPSPDHRSISPRFLPFSQVSPIISTPLLVTRPSAIHLV